MGRPSLLTKSRETALLQAIEGGLSLKHAAMFAGICYETLNRWRKRGEIETAPAEFRQFCQALRRSEAIALHKLVGYVVAAAPKDWRAATWMLERRYPDDFGRLDKIESRKSPNQPPFSDDGITHEVLARMKKQSGAAEVMVKLAEIIERKKKERAELEFQAQQTKKAVNLRE